MIFMQKIMFFALALTLCNPSFFIVKAKPEESTIKTSSADIEPNCKAMVDPNGNPLEQLIDLFYQEYRYGFGVQTPDRWVPLIDIRKEKDGKISRIVFEVPHRIDMQSEYSDQIYEDIKTRQEVPFAAFRFVGNVANGQSGNIVLEHWAREETLYNGRLVNAGKHGVFFCYNNVEEGVDVECMSLESFRGILRNYKTKEARKEPEN